jgi:Uma2 family endonuclease
MVVSFATYERVALEDPEEQWELFGGHLRKKPSMTQEHNTVAFWLGHLIQNQVDRKVYQVRVNQSRTKRADASYFIPDVVVIPRALMRSYGESGPIESYEQPLPFVAEVWSRSTGDYDVDEKFPEYRRRGDQEIWRVHPYMRAVTVWRRQPDGSYSETVHERGTVPIESLPGVAVSLEDLFAELP